MRGLFGRTKSLHPFGRRWAPTPDPVIHPYTSVLRISVEVGLGVVATHAIPTGTLVWVQDRLDRGVGPSVMVARRDLLIHGPAWDEESRALLQAARTVPQPLLTFAVDRPDFESMLAGHRPVPSFATQSPLRPRAAPI